MLNPFEKIKIPPRIEDFIESESGRLRSIGGKSIREREIRRLRDYRERIDAYLQFVRSFPRVNQLHPFYRTSLEIASGSLDRVRICLSVIARNAVLAQRILAKYEDMIRRSPEERANLLMRSGFGRASSILRRSRDCVDWISKVSSELSKGKAIDPELPTIIVAGPPNAGKSTLYLRYPQPNLKSPTIHLLQRRSTSVILIAVLRFK